MKKLLMVILCAALLLCALPASVSAAVTFSKDAPKLNAPLVIDCNSWEFSSSTGSIVNVTSKTSMCIKADASATYKFKAAKDGVYTFAMQYVARTGSVRGQDYAIDGGKRVYTKLEECADNNDKRWMVIEETLTAGDHTITFYAPTGFDDSTLKSCDLYYIKAALSKEIVSTTAAATTSKATAAATTAKANTSTSAAQTFDPISISALLLAASGVSVFIARRKRG